MRMWSSAPSCREALPIPWSIIGAPPATILTDRGRGPKLVPTGRSRSRAGGLSARSEQLVEGGEEPQHLRRAGEAVAGGRLAGADPDRAVALAHGGEDLLVGAVIAGE